MNTATCRSYNDCCSDKRKKWGGGVEGGVDGGKGGSDERMLYSRAKTFSVFQENRNSFHPHANLAHYFYFPKLNLG